MNMQHAHKYLTLSFGEVADDYALLKIKDANGVSRVVANDGIRLIHRQKNDWIYMGRELNRTNIVRWISRYFGADEDKISFADEVLEWLRERNC